MADSFSLRIGLEGEKEFKAALRDIQQSFKVLGSEMNLVTSQFDRNDRSVQALTARNSLLNREIDTQKGKIETLERALRNASDSFGATDKRTQAWQIQLNNAKAELNGMERELQDNTRALDKTGDEFNQAEREAKQFDSALDRTKKTADSASDRFSRLGSVLGTIGRTMGTALLAIGTAAAGAASALTRMSVDAASYADEILTLSTVTGISTESLQAYRYASELVDVSMETLTGTMARNIRSMNIARKGTGDAAKAYKELGVSIVDSKGELRDSETVYWEAVDALGRLQNETERDALAMTLFGRSAQELNPLIAQGSEGITRLTEEAKSMGAVLSGESLSSLGTFDDSIQRLKSTSNAARNALGTVLLPQLQVLADEGTALLGEFTRGLSDANGDWEQISDVIGKTIGGLAEKLIGYLPQFLELGLDILSSIGKAILENLPIILQAAVRIVMTLLKGLLTVLPTLTDGALQLVLALVEGILENLPALVEGAIRMVATLAEGIGEALPALVPAILEALLLMVQVLLDNLPLLLDAAMQLVEGLADGIILALPLLMEKLPQILIGIIEYVTNNLPKMVSLGITLLVELGKGLIRAIPLLLAQLPQVIGALVNGLGLVTGPIFDIGKNLVSGLWEGILSMVSWLKEKIDSFVRGIVDGIKGVLGIQSPSRVFAGIGDNMARGIGEGFEDQMEKVARDLQNAIPTDFDTKVSVSSGERIVRHLFSGSIRIEGVGDQGQFVSAVDAVMEQLKMDALLAGY